MSQRLVGSLVASGLSFGIVVGRFNEFITDRLLAGCVEALERHGADPAKVTVAVVPGAFEIPLAAKAMAESGKYDAVICLGCVIRGATAHFDYVAGEAAKGIGQVAMATGLPVVFGVLTTDTLEQSIERAGSKGGNKGAESAVTAIEMANLLKDLRR
ncbi:MAG: 6,7-dimethyl-8-ribityllumazine synthase [Candidatus Sericytochromatia bacterium]|nr:6,7-dimethyl-8-ribityllumazine synthase [Candidatus Sericytochromatia bacterium]